MIYDTMVPSNMEAREAARRLVEELHIGDVCDLYRKAIAVGSDASKDWQRKHRARLAQTLADALIAACDWGPERPIPKLSEPFYCPDCGYGPYPHNCDKEAD